MRLDARADLSDLRAAIDRVADFHERAAREQRIVRFLGSGDARRAQRRQKRIGRNRQERLRTVERHRAVEQGLLLFAEPGLVIERRVVPTAIGEPPVFDERTENAHEQVLFDRQIARQRNRGYAKRPRLGRVRRFQMLERSCEHVSRGGGVDVGLRSSHRNRLASSNECVERLARILRACVDAGCSVRRLRSGRGRIRAVERARFLQAGRCLERCASDSADPSTTPPPSSDFGLGAPYDEANARKCNGWFAQMKLGRNFVHRIGCAFEDQRAEYFGRAEVRANRRAPAQ